MALEDCPECGTQVSTTIANCPHCGWQPESPTVILWDSFSGDQQFGCWLRNHNE